jgi:hypothetical protein
MQGEERAWELLAARDPRDVCERAEAGYSPGEGSYTLGVFGFPVVVAPASRTMSGSCAESELILTKAGYFSRLSILHYLLGAQRTSPAGLLVKPSDLKSGHIYLQGSHVLPLDQMAARFARDAADFLKHAGRFGGEPRAYGDAGVELRPLPRLPVTLVFWREDDEFPARSDLLFDATCEQHVPGDILWSVAMLCMKVMLLP